MSRFNPMNLCRLILRTGLTPDRKRPVFSPRSFILPVFAVVFAWLGLCSATAAVSENETSAFARGRNILCSFMDAARGTACEQSALRGGAGGSLFSQIQRSERLSARTLLHKLSPAVLFLMLSMFLWHAKRPTLPHCSSQTFQIHNLLRTSIPIRAGPAAL